jgi:single-stranded-DNA-specific exonuclease
MKDKIWRIYPLSIHTSRLAHETGISALKAQLLINRGITDKDTAASFLTPRLSDLTEPMLLKDMDRALDLIINAVEKQEHIAVFGDYDADGITSTALIFNFFSDLSIPISYYIPDRINEGYSLNSSAIKILSDKGVRLIITVDCGISNTEEIEQARSLGIEVVVTDHHQIPNDFNPVCPVINPNRPDSSFPFRDLAGVGVAFFLVAGIRARMREKGWFEKCLEPDLRDYLDLVAIGTVADMVPLVGHNRIMVLSGIEVMRNSRWPGIRAIKEISGIDDSTLSSGDLAFKISPRLNAPGRIGDSNMGLKALITKSDPIAREIAGALNNMNSERQRIESKILDQLEDTMLPGFDLDNRRTIVLSRPGWHIGVLGIVASRLLDKYHRPTLLLTIKDGLAVGSGRSIDGYNLHKSMSRLDYLFEKFGGHYHAAGCTLNVENIGKLAEGLEAIAQEKLKEENLIPAINIDGEISLDDLTYENVRDIRSLEPFGAGNPEPIFFSSNLEVINSRIVGEKHLKLKVKQGGTFLDAIGFGMSDTHHIEGEIINMVHTPEINRWNGYESVQLRVTDLELKDEDSKLVKLY